MKYFKYDVIVFQKSVHERFSATGIIVGNSWSDAVEALDKYYAGELERIIDLSVVQSGLYEEARNYI